ncbi:hypothetical protein [Metasolibacillus sp. FSL K6-0083]|uniref:hypothetical protein n=2 Tax=unclassified Metasolibacillus TaxID=2703679 RepID=UPI00315A29E7
MKYTKGLILSIVFAMIFSTIGPSISFAVENKNDFLDIKSEQLETNNLLTTEEKIQIIDSLNDYESIYIDSTQVEAYALPLIPVLVGLLGRSGLNFIIKQFGKKAIQDAVKDTSKKMAKKSLGKGSTGRQVPNDLVEEIFMNHVLDNPLLEADELPLKLNDNRWHHS